MAFRPLRQQRYNNYIKNGFAPFEAREFSGIRYKEAPYLRKMIRDRANIQKAFNKQADITGMSKTKRASEYLKVIKQEYIDYNWIREKQVSLIGRTQYKASPWEMLKAYRQKAIDNDEYHPVKGKSIRRVGDKIYIHISKGDVEGQKRRQRAKIKSLQPGTPEYERFKRQRAAQKQRAKERKWAKEH